MEADTMDIATFETFTTCDLSKAWDIIRTEVAVQLTGERDVIPIPFLFESSQYELLSVLVKGDGGTLDKLMGRSVTFLPVGRMDMMLSKGNMSYDHVVQDATSDSADLKKSYEFKLEGFRKGIKKGIYFSLSTVNRQSCSCIVPRDDMFYLDRNTPGLKGAKKIYLVTDVWTIQSCKLHCYIDKREKETNLKGEMPIAFKYEKHSLGKDGAIGPKVACDVTTAHSAQWVRRSSFRHPRDRLPSLPTDNLPSVPSGKGPLPPLPTS